MKKPPGFDVKAEIDLSATSLPPAISRIRPATEACLSTISFKEGWEGRNSLATVLTAAGLFALTYLIGRSGNYSGLPLISFCCVVAFIGAAARRSKLPKGPVILEIYALGLWFGQDKVFVPFECLRTVEIKLKRARERSPFLRRMVFTAEGASERRDERMTTWHFLLPSEEPFITDTYENILYKVREIAANHFGDAVSLPTSFILEDNPV